MDDLVDLLDSDDDITPKSNESSVCVQQRNEKMFDKQNEAEEEKENSKRAEILKDILKIPMRIQRDSEGNLKDSHANPKEF